MCKLPETAGLPEGFRCPCYPGGCNHFLFLYLGRQQMPGIIMVGKLENLFLICNMLYSRLISNILVHDLLNRILVQ
jgi:hypothetical protein